MSRHWLAGAVLFSLGFGCAKLVTLPAAGATSTSGVVEGTLKYIDGADDFELIYPSGGETDYMVIASRKLEPGTTSSPKISYATGSAMISKQGLKRLTVYRLTPLIAWNGDTIRCDPDPPIHCPLPPPPPPDHEYTFLPH